MAVLLEVCVDSAEGLVAAIAGGADRIELCSALELGGLTPTPGMIALARNCPIPVHALIRPRGGDFVFSPDDAEQMLGDIAAVRAAGLAGVVLGASLADNRLDSALLGRLVKVSSGLSLTLHRAFDLVPDLVEAVETAVGLGFSRILTSGGAARAAEGVTRLQATIAAARGRIGILPGSGITAANAAALVKATGVREVHASCSKTIAGGSAAAQQLGFAEPTRRATDVEAVSALKAVLQAL